MTYCNNCGEKTRKIFPVMVKKPRGFSDPNRVLPRGALTNEQNAAIPYGEHPDDGAFASWCEECATGLVTA